MSRYIKILLLCGLTLSTACGAPEPTPTPDRTVVSGEVQTFFLDILQEVDCTVHSSPGQPFDRPRLMNDADGSVWVVYNRLLSFVPGSAVRGQELVLWNTREQFSLELDDALIGKSLVAAASSGAGRLWLAYPDGVIETLRDVPPFESTTAPTPEGLGRVLEIVTDSGDQVAMLHQGSDSEGVSIISLYDGDAWQRLPSFNGADPVALTFDVQKRLWAVHASQGQDITVASWEAGEWSLFSTATLEARLDKMLVDSRGRVWLGTDRGMYRFNRPLLSETGWELVRETDLLGETLRMLEHSDTGWQARQRGIVIDTGELPIAWGIPGVSDMALDAEDNFYVVFRPDIATSQLLICPPGSGLNQ